MAISPTDYDASKSESEKLTFWTCDGLDASSTGSMRGIRAHQGSSELRLRKGECEFSRYNVLETRFLSGMVAVDRLLDSFSIS